MTAGDDAPPPLALVRGDDALRVYPLLRGQTVSSLDYHPAYHHRFMGSALWAASTGDEFKAAVALVYVSIATQDPGGTLPCDEVRLAHAAICGTDMALWQRVRRKAMTGWERVSVADAGGVIVEVRYAHPEVEDIVLGMWKLKAGAMAEAAGRRVRQQCYRIREQLRKLGQDRVAESEAVVSSIRDWLEERGLIISRDNVREAAWRIETGKLL